MAVHHRFAQKNAGSSLTKPAPYRKFIDIIELLLSPFSPALHPALLIETVSVEVEDKRNKEHYDSKSIGKT